MWYQYALAHLAAGDAEACDRVCVRLVKRVGPSENTSNLYWVARACVLAPDALGELAPPGRLAEKLSVNDPRSYYDLSLLGALLYRAGRWDEAVKRLEQALKARPDGGTATIWLLRAMAHHRLGDPNKAEEWLDKAVNRIEPAGSSQSAVAGVVLSWDQRLELELLSREARTLLKGGKP